MAAPSHIPRLTLMRTPFVKMSLANPRSSTWLLGSERSKRRGPCPGAGYFRALLLDSRVFHDQQLNERRKQRFASLSGVVHKLVTLNFYQFVARQHWLRAAPLLAVFEPI